MDESLLLITAKILSYRNRAQNAEKKKLVRFMVFFFAALLFWAGTFYIFFRVLSYFAGIEVIGTLLAARLLSMVFLTCFSLLLFSNIITGLSTFFLSDDLQLINALPVSATGLYAGRFIETAVNSSWTVLFFSSPVFVAYGLVYHASPAYYLALAGVMCPFVLIPAAAGIMLILLLVSLFPARRLKEILVLAFILIAVGVFLFVRFLQPERLVDPESFYLVMDYISNLRAPLSPLFPSQWAADAVSPFLFDAAGGWTFPLMLLWSTGLAFVVMGEGVFRWRYFAAWSKAQEANAARFSRSALPGGALDRLLQPFSPGSRCIIMKDLKIFLRDTNQWTQLFLIGALIIIYVYNFSVLPMERSPLPTFYLQNVIAFLNLGLAAFVIAAIAGRFTFPGVSVEGKSFWILKASPLELRTLLWSKFWVNFFFLLVPAEVLIVTTNLLMHASPIMQWLSVITMAGMTVGITSLGIGCGARFPRFNAENVAQVATGFGGMFYMILAMVFIALVVMLEARPVYLFFMAQFRGIPLNGWELAEMWALLAAAVLLNVLVAVLPMRLGLKSLSSLEE
jgi:ABC-2 type transport system permease protein